MSMIVVLVQRFHISMFTEEGDTTITNEDRKEF